MPVTSTRISLEVETASGQVAVAFGPNHHVGAIIGEALARIEREPDGTYQLVRENGDILDPRDTLNGTVSDGETLWLEANPAGGI